MTDTRKIRICYEIDVTLDQSEYGGGDASEALAYIRSRTATAWDKRNLIEEWDLDLDAHFSAEIVK